MIDINDKYKANQFNMYFYKGDEELEHIGVAKNSEDIIDITTRYTRDVLNKIAYYVRMSFKDDMIIVDFGSYTHFIHVYPIKEELK